MPYFKYLKNRIKFNDKRKKLAITPFFAEFLFLEEESTYPLGSHSLHTKKLKNFQKSFFLGEKIHFSPISSEISKIPFKYKIVDNSFFITTPF